SLNITKLMPAGRVDVAGRYLKRIVEGEQVAFENLRLRKDGTTFPIEVNAGPLCLGDKHYVLAFAKDISERKKTEKEVAMLAHAVRSIQECVAITDFENTILFVND